MRETRKRKTRRKIKWMRRMRKRRSKRNRRRKREGTEKKSGELEKEEEGKKKGGHSLLPAGAGLQETLAAAEGTQDLGTSYMSYPFSRKNSRHDLYLKE